MSNKQFSNDSIANALNLLGGQSSTTNEARFEVASVRVGSHDTYIGNFSMPLTMSEESRAVIVAQLGKLGLKLSFERKAPAEITADMFA